MRVSPVGFAFDGVEEVLREARKTAEVTHNHGEGIKGAQATALAVLLARTGATKREIRSEIQGRFGYDLERSVEGIRPAYHFDVSCQGSVPEAILSFLDSSSYEDAVRNAVSLGGDSDTLACIAGGIAEAFYGGVPQFIAAKAMGILDEYLRNIAVKFVARYGGRGT
jgi:ADP-ribosylglycohydrolase